MNSEVQIRENKGEIQRIQIVRMDSFADLHFLKPDYDFLAFERVCQLYEGFIMHKYASIMGKVVLFTLADEDVPFEVCGGRYGQMYEKLDRLKALFRQNAFLKDDQIAFKDPGIAGLYEQLQKEGRLFVCEGKRKRIDFIPVGKECGFLSKSFKDCEVAVNSCFFVMDELDCATVFDHVGIPFGLMKEGDVIHMPPAYGRQALLVDRQGRVSIQKVELSKISVELDDVIYEDGRNARFYTRPAYQYTPEGSADVVIVNNKAVALNQKGHTPVPAGGFVMKVKDLAAIRDRSVSYHGLEEYVFAVQTGNSVIIDGQKTTRFISPFYHLGSLTQAVYPPSLYPLNYKKDRAPRILLGADEENRPMLVWIEGAGKFNHVKGEEGEGVSLREAAEIAESLGMVNGIHLDGGGSAQILLKGQRMLKISDRDSKTFQEKERAIPMALVVYQSSQR